MQSGRGYATHFGFVPNYRLVPGPEGPAGPAGPTGANFLGFTSNDRQGRASINTSSDLYGMTILPPSFSLGALNLLESVLYTENGTGPYRTPVTQASIVNVLNAYGAGEDELGPFQVDGLASGTGTIELESAFGFLTSAVQGLGFHPASQTTGVLSSSGSIAYTVGADTSTLGPVGLVSSDGVHTASVAPTGVVCSNGVSSVSISSTGLGVSTGTHVTSTLSPTGLHIYTPNNGGTGVFLVDSVSSLVQCQHANLALGAYTLPSGVFTGTASDTSSASFLVASDFSQDVYLELPSNRPIGSLYIAKKNSTQNHHLYVTVQGGGAIDGSSSHYDVGIGNYASKGFLSLGNGNYVAF